MKCADTYFKVVDSLGAFTGETSQREEDSQTIAQDGRARTCPSWCLLL